MNLWSLVACSIVVSLLHIKSSHCATVDIAQLLDDNQLPLAKDPSAENIIDHVYLVKYDVMGMVENETYYIETLAKFLEIPPSLVTVISTPESDSSNIMRNREAHLRALEKIVEADGRSSLILERGVNILLNAGSILSNSLSKIKQEFGDNWGVLLGDSIYTHYAELKSGLLRPSYFIGTVAYVVNKISAELILQTSKTMPTSPIDDILLTYSINNPGMVYLSRDSMALSCVKSSGVTYSSIIEFLNPRLGLNLTNSDLAATHPLMNCPPDTYCTSTADCVHIERKLGDMNPLSMADLDILLQELAGPITELNKIVMDTSELVEGNILYVHETTVHAYLLRNKILNILNSVIGKRKVMEIGFNAGHSALLMIAVNPYANYTFFDIGIHNYTRPCYAYLFESHKPQDMRLVLGDSTQTVPVFAYANPAELFSYDLIHIDGGHTYRVAMLDLLNSHILASYGNVLILDDTNSDVIAKAWNDMKSQNLTVEDHSILPTYLYQHKIGSYKLYDA